MITIKPMCVSLSQQVWTLNQCAQYSSVGGPYQFESCLDFRWTKCSCHFSLGKTTINNLDQEAEELNMLAVLKWRKMLVWGCKWSLYAPRIYGQSADSMIYDWYYKVHSRFVSHTLRIAILCACLRIRDCVEKYLTFEQPCFVLELGL